MAVSRVVSEIFNVEKCCVLEIRVRGHSKSSEPTDTDRSDTCDFLLTFHSNYGPISHSFPPTLPVTFTPPWTVLPLKLGIGAWGQKKLMMGLPEARKKYIK